MCGLQCNCYECEQTEEAGNVECSDGECIDWCAYCTKKYVQAVEAAELQELRV